MTRGRFSAFLTRPPEPPVRDDPDGKLRAELDREPHLRQQIVEHFRRLRNRALIDAKAAVVERQNELAAAYFEGAHHTLVDAVMFFGGEGE